MGEHKVIRCTDCKAYADVGRVHPHGESDQNESWKQQLVEFVHDHMGHDVTLLGEYGGTQDRWMETDERNGWEKVDDNE